MARKPSDATDTTAAEGPKLLEQYTPDEIAEEAARLNRIFGEVGGREEYFQWIGKLRVECFERRAATMDPTRALAGWAAQMTAKFKASQVQVFRGIYSWLAGLAVARYGEAPDHWPAKFSDDDVVRAKRWLYEGNRPEGVTYIEVEG